MARAGPTYPVISERTYAEWSDDHPGKRLPVLPDESLHQADFVVCTIKGESREPAPGMTMMWEPSATVVKRPLFTAIARLQYEKSVGAVFGL
jgi:hypothetical protein